MATSPSFRLTRSIRIRASPAAASTMKRPVVSLTRSGLRASCSPLSCGHDPKVGWELIAGERRLRAAREASLATVPAVVRQADDRDSLLLALVENVAREDLSPVEEARAYAVLMDEFDLALTELSQRVGLSKPMVSNRLRLLELSDDILAMVERGELSEGHARAVLAVPDQEGRRRLAHEIVKRGLTVREAERAARWQGAKRKPRKAAKVDPVLADRACAAAQLVTGMRARIAPGRLEIVFADEVELAELTEALETAAGRPLESSTAGD